VTGYEWFTRYLAASGSGHLGPSWQCPAHEDSSPSLSVAVGEDGRALVKCHGGCSTERVPAAVGVDYAVLFEGHVYSPERTWALQRIKICYPPMVAGGGRGRATRGLPTSIEYHVYVEGRYRVERARYANRPKQIKWQHRYRRDWEYGLAGRSIASLPLYEEVQVRMAVAGGEPVLLVESESSVDALMSHGLYATTWAGGAENPNIERLLGVLAGARVLWIPDHDPAGLRCSAVIVDALQPCCELSVLTPDEGMDARDLLGRVGHSAFLGAVTG